MSNNDHDQTLVLIKPDALKLSLAGYLLSRLSETNTGLIIAGTKVVNVSRMLAEEHYAEHVGKVFFPSLIDYIRGCSHYSTEASKRRVKVILYDGKNAVKKIRDMAGPTDPHIARETNPGCIRSLGTVIPLKDDNGEVIGSRMDNLIHASASDEEAEREIKLWLLPTEIPPMMRKYACKRSEDHVYFRDGQVSVEHEPGSVCLIAPGDVVWETDLDALHTILEGGQPKCPLNSILAKYLINRE